MAAAWLPSPANAAKVRQAQAAQAAAARQRAGMHVTPPSPLTGTGNAMFPNPNGAAPPNVYVPPVFKQARSLPTTKATPNRDTRATLAGPLPDAHVIALQKSLVKQGYHITVDGVMGPQTKQALYASQHPNGAHTASVPDPNAVVSPRTANNRPSTQGYMGSGYAPSGKGNKNAPPGGGVKVVSGKTGQTLFPAFLNSGAKVPAWQNIGMPGYDPDKLATDSINAKYAPILGGFDQSTKDITNAGSNRQADIASAYNSTIANAQTATNAADVRIQGAADKTAGIPAAIAASMGLSPEMAAALAGQGIINAQGTQNEANSDIKANDQSVENMRLGREYASNVAGRNTDTALAGVRADRQTALSNEGTDLAAAKQQARSDYADKVTAIQTANRQGLLSTAQARQAVNDAGRNAKLTYLNTLAGAKSAGIQLAGLTEQAREFDVKNAFAEKQLSSQTALAKLKIGQTNGNKADNAAQGAYKTIVGPRGWPRYGTNRAYTIASQQLQAAGLKPGTKAFQQRMNYVMNAAHIKLGPGGKPTGLAGKPPGAKK